MRNSKLILLAMSLLLAACGQGTSGGSDALSRDAKTEASAASAEETATADQQAGDRSLNNNPELRAIIIGRIEAPYAVGGSAHRSDMDMGRARVVPSNWVARIADCALPKTSQTVQGSFGDNAVSNAARAYKTYAEGGASQLTQEENSMVIWLSAAADAEIESCIRSQVPMGELENWPPHQR